MLRCLILLLIVAGLVQARTDVWVVADTTRVLRSDPLPTPLPPPRLDLAAAKGEWESCQIFVRADQPVTISAIQVGELRGPNGAVIPTSAWRSYREHALELTAPSFLHDKAPGARPFEPGWYPDALIPTVHPLTGEPLTGGRYQALPFEVPANETHGFLLDLGVPRDAAAGDYRGDVTLILAAGEPLVVPVALHVWNFALPETPAMVTALGDPLGRMRSFYKKQAEAGGEPEPTDWDAVAHQTWEFLRRHRINATPPSFAPAEVDGAWVVSDEKVDALREFIDRYQLNAMSVAHPRSVIKDPVAEADKLKAWFAAWDDALTRLNRPEVTFFIYLKDEPNDEEEYQYVQTWGKAVKATGTKVQVMVVEQSKTQNPEWGDLYGAVDIWCPLFPLFDPETAASRQALGETVWTYTALCQRAPTPWWQIDFPLLNYRVPTWLMWRYNMKGLLYWGGMVYWSGSKDMWTDPKTLDRTDRNPLTLYQGEGTLLYPGRAVGFDGIVPSLRLKALREGIDDFDYLALLEGTAQEAEARQLIESLAGSWFEWELDPAAYQTARRRLGELVELSQQ